MLSLILLVLLAPASPEASQLVSLCLGFPRLTLAQSRSVLLEDWEAKGVLDEGGVH